MWMYFFYFIPLYQIISLYLKTRIQTNNNSKIYIQGLLSAQTSPADPRRSPQPHTKLFTYVLDSGAERINLEIDRNYLTIGPHLGARGLT